MDDTLVPQVMAPPETPHVPLLVLNLTEPPDAVKAIVAHVCVLELHVPLVSRQPIPDESRRYPRIGILVTYIYLLVVHQGEVRH